MTPKEKQNWPKHCNYLSHEYNATVDSATGMTPFYFMFGRHPKLIGYATLDNDFDRFVGSLKKAYQLCTQKLREQKLKNKQFYDKKLSCFKT